MSAVSFGQLVDKLAIAACSPAKDLSSDWLLSLYLQFQGLAKSSGPLTVHGISWLGGKDSEPHSAQLPW